MTTGRALVFVSDIRVAMPVAFRAVLLASIGWERRATR